MYILTRKSVVLTKFANVNTCKLAANDDSRLYFSIQIALTKKTQFYYISCNVGGGGCSWDPCFNVNARGGQSMALQRFSAAPVSNFGCATKLCMTNLCIKYPKFTLIMWSLCKKMRQKNLCSPKYNILMKFGPSEKKSGHPWSMLFSMDYVKEK